MRTPRLRLLLLGLAARHPSLGRTRSVLALFAALAALVGSAPGQSLRIYVIDVEQGASTLLVSPAGNTLLVDAGKNGHGARVRAVMTTAGVTRIDHFVATHYHEDHFGGIDDLVNLGVTVTNAYDRGEKDDLEPSKLAEPTYIDYQAAVGSHADQLDRGETIPLDPAMTVTCVASGGMVIGEQNPTVGTDENDMSVALLVQFGNFRYFVGGDIELTTEGKIAARDLVLDVDFYQADHHGSNTSSSLPFMQDLRPTIVVISNGNNGTYKHPRQHTLDLLAGLSPAPAVFQTNKYLKGSSGGNVADSFIADPQTTDQDGTILVTVTPATGQLVVSYPDASQPFAIKSRGGTGGTGGATGGGIVIESLLPNPVGSDNDLEAVTIRNTGTAIVPLTGWMVRDADNHALSLASLGQIAPGQSLTILRDGAGMSLNNDGDTITLVAPGNQVRDSFTYASSSEGQLITTGH